MYRLKLNALDPAARAEGVLVRELGEVISREGTNIVLGFVQLNHLRVT